MRFGSDHGKASAQDPPRPRDILEEKRTYRVVLDDISSGIETVDSFAIKFSLFTKSPLARMKHIVRRLPATVWAGEGRSRAERVLALIEEAGGRGRVVEADAAPVEAPESREDPPNSAKVPEAERTCAMCGFPMKSGETRCGFCMTAAGGAGRVDPQPVPASSVKTIPRKRFLLYGACLLVGLILITIFLR